jgi:hypothetical protein
MMNAGLGAIAPRNPNPMASQPQPFQQLLALNEAVKTANLERAAQGQQAMSQAQQMSPTIYDQLKMALQQAQAQQPVPGMASGGMVAFDKGGLAEADLEDLDEDLVAEGATSQEAQDRQSILSALSSMGMTAEKLAAAGYDVFTMPVRALAGVYNTLARGPRAFGVPLPFIPEAFGQNSLTPAMDKITARENQAGVVQAYPEPRAIRESKPPAGLAAAAAAAAAPVARPPARPPAARTAGTGAGVGGAGDAAAPQRGGLAEYLRMSEQLAKGVEGTAAVDPRVLEARQAYDAMLKASIDPAEQQMRELEAQQEQNIFENPELMAAILEGMRGTDRLGDTLMGAATGLVKARAGQQKGRREAQANLVKLRQELARAEAEARLARAEKDTEGEQRAKLKAAEIRAAMNEKYTELEIKQTTANAAATAAANRGEATAGRSDFQKDSLVRRAIADVQSKNPIPSSLKGSARQRLIDQQIDAVATQVAPLGVTREQVVGYFSTSGQASAAPGATTQGWGTATVVEKP